MTTIMRAILTIIRMTMITRTEPPIRTPIRTTDTATITRITTTAGRRGYVVILVPIILFLLGLPNKGPTIHVVDDVAAREEAMVQSASMYTGLVCLDTWSQLAWLAKRADDVSLAEGIPATIKMLDESKDDSVLRADFKNKVVTVVGQYVQNSRDPRVFTLARLRMNCCAGDAIARQITVISQSPFQDLKDQSWIKVTGKVEYARGAEGKMAVRLSTIGPANVKETAPRPWENNEQ